MSTIVKTAKSIWNEYGHVMHVVKREINDMGKYWVETEAYWSKHPETRTDYFGSDMGF